jgi:hypothetical protein
VATRAGRSKQSTRVGCDCHRGSKVGRLWSCQRAKRESTTEHTSPGHTRGVWWWVVVVVLCTQEVNDLRWGLFCPSSSVALLGLSTQVSVVCVTCACLEINSDDTHSALLSEWICNVPQHKIVLGSARPLTLTTAPPHRFSQRTHPCTHASRVRRVLKATCRTRR